MSRSFLNVSYGDHPMQKLDLYLPDAENFPTFLYFHGGGLEKGDKTRTAHVGAYLSARGIAFISANYRLYPDAKYPDFIRDAALAAAWVKNRIGEYGGSNRVYLGGSSAGAYLSMMLCFDATYLAAHRLTPCDFAAFLHDAGQPTKHFRVLRELGIDPKRIIVDEAAPLYHIGTAPVYPPMRLIVSDHDMQNRYEQTCLTLSTLRHFGYPEDRFDWKLMQGKHCAYVKELDEHGESVFGAMILAFMQTYS